MKRMNYFKIYAISWNETAVILIRQIYGLDPSQLFSERLDLLQCVNLAKLITRKAKQNGY